MKLEELLNYMEFDYKINPNGTMSLVDLTGVNLGNIESEEFKLNTDLALNVLDRLDNYINDYFFDDFVENLRNHDEENFKAKGYDEFYYGEDIIALADEYGDAFKDDRYDLVYAVVNPESVDVSTFVKMDECRGVCKVSKIAKLTEELNSVLHEDLTDKQIDEIVNLKTIDDVIEYCTHNINEDDLTEVISTVIEDLEPYGAGILKFYSDIQGDTNNHEQIVMLMRQDIIDYITEKYYSSKTI